MNDAAFRQPPLGQPLIGSDEPPPFEIVNPSGKAPLVLLCDHASRRIPAAFRKLGLDDAAFDLHIAYDIGAADVTRILTTRLDAPAVLAGYSRLLIDLNRQPGDPTSIPPVSDDVHVPGNRGMSREAQRRRVETFFWPYHKAAGDTIARQWKQNAPPAVFAVHSFTPRMGGRDRKWHVGVLSNRDRRMADPLLAALGTHGDLVVGDNEPYSGKDVAYTLDVHGTAAGLPHCSVEIRQDLVADVAGIRRWADILAVALGGIVGRADLHRVQRF